MAITEGRWECVCVVSRGGRVGGRQVEGRASTRRPGIKCQVCLGWPEPLPGAVAGPGEETSPWPQGYPHWWGRES